MSLPTSWPEISWPKLRTANGLAEAKLNGGEAVEHISYVWTAEGWLYLAVILDLHSRRVVGWAVSDRMKKDLAIRALEMAVRLRNPPPGCMFRSDRGSQYCSYDYQKKLQAHGLRPSMSGKGNCYDNSAVETLLATPPSGSNR